MQRKIGKLDGLRGLASLVVVFSHLFLWFSPSAHYGSSSELNMGLDLFNSPFSFFYRGDFAVYLFFILSGLVLTRSLQSKSGNLLEIRKAALKRYLRLGIPVAASILICYALMTLRVFHTPDVDSLAELTKHYGFDESFFSAAKDATFGALLFGNNQYNYVLWSISIEFFGSIAIFSAMALFWINRSIYRWVCVAIAAVLFVSDQRTYLYIGLFFVGSLMATLRFSEEAGTRNRLASFLLIMAGLYLAGFYDGSTSYAYITAGTEAVSNHFERELVWDILIPSIGAALIIAGVLFLGKASAVLESRFLRWLGNLSFSVYLLHSFILALCAQVAIAWFGISYLSFGVTAIATFLLTLAASHYFYLHVDAPAVGVASRFSKWALALSGQPRPGWATSPLAARAQSS